GHQAGEIQLRSRLSVFPFRADANGNVSREIVVPRDTALGDHTVKLCWSGTCHAQAALRVVDSSAFIGPPNFTPGATASPGGSPGVSPTPLPSGSPVPTSGTGGTTGTGGTRSRPTPPRAPSPPPPPPPSPTPTLPPNPCPTSTQAAVVTVSPETIIAGVTS